MRISNKTISFLGCLSLIFNLSVNVFGQVSFLDRSGPSGINSSGNNHGVSFGDFNNDGLEDIYVAVRDANAPNLLYKNTGNGMFTEMSSLARVAAMEESAAAVWGDMNNDGWLDLYVGNSTTNKLYLNKGDETFEDITLSAQVGDPGDARSVQFADVDDDGLLDIYVHNFNEENVLYRNSGDLTFENVTVASGATDTGPAMGTIFFDYDNDGDLDLYLLNDGSTNVLYSNSGEGVFEDVSQQSGLDLYCSCMGVDIGDYNQDGFFDMYITNFGVNYIYLNNGDGSFSELGNALGVDDLGMGWGTFWFDFDNDSYSDIYLANNHFVSSRPNILYRNHDGSAFTPVSQNSDLESPFASFGTASADVDNDGWLDIFVANWGGNSGNQLFINEGAGYHSVKIKTIGTTSNHSGIGAVIRIKTGDIIQTDQVTAATGYASQNSLVLHFGTGQYQTIDELNIKWPSGIEEIFTNISVNQLLTITEQSGMVSQSFGGVATASAEHEQFRLGQNYPNPFSDRTIIPVSLEKTQSVNLEVYNLGGKKIRILAHVEMQPGNYYIEWDGRDGQGNVVENGLYIYKLSMEDASRILVKKLILNR